MAPVVHGLEKQYAGRWISSTWTSRTPGTTAPSARSASGHAALFLRKRGRRGPRLDAGRGPGGQRPGHARST